MTQKESILKYISKMDTEMLSVVLDDNRTYQEATKSVLKGKLENVFSEFKSKGDKELVQLPGNSETDESVIIECKRYTFIGNNSASYIIVVFEENEVSVTDIFDSWNSGGNNLNSEFFKRFSLTIKSSEDITNVSPINYLIKVKKCNDALNEICRDEINYLHKENYIEWLDKYEYLKDDYYSLFFYPYPKLENFNNLFFTLSQFKLYLSLSEDCVKANNDYRTIDISNEDKIIEWLKKVEQLGNKIYPIIETSLNEDENEDEFPTGYVTVHEDLQIKISTKDFKNVLEFIGNYLTHYVRFCIKDYEK